MCDQTEIKYLDGDVVWVKLGSAWWPGQVVGFENLPADVQNQFKNKTLIAAVKFFQEDSYEFVKNLQQIYKYNCRQKDDFIKKGLDKYRAKIKDATNYMEKFPSDVELAEKLTGGDPDILTSSKFCEQKKPDISSLFGEKKQPKRKKDKDETSRKSLSNNNTRKIITHPRFSGRKSDHEIRIRQQNTTNNTSTPNSNLVSNFFTCPHCDFTSTRVDVIVCHNKSHLSIGYEPTTPIRRPSPQKSRSVSGVGVGGSGEIQKRKYVRKNKSLSAKLKIEKTGDTPKRKYSKQGVEKAAKKKKNDPEVKEKLRETLLADWADGSDDGDMDIDIDNSTSDDLLNSPSKNTDKININQEKESDKDDKSSTSVKNSNNRVELDGEVEKHRSPLLKKFKKSDTVKTNSSTAEKDDDKSKFSCFDFDEDEEPQPTLPPARKITRVFGEKNTSRKKELIKEFTRNSLANEKIAENKVTNEQKPEDKKVEKINKEIKPIVDNVNNDDEDNDDDDDDDDDLNDKINQAINETTELVAKIAETTENSTVSISEEAAGTLEIVDEVLEVERDTVEEELKEKLEQEEVEEKYDEGKEIQLEKEQEKAELKKDKDDDMEIFEERKDDEIKESRIEETEEPRVEGMKKRQVEEKDEEMKEPQVEEKDEEMEESRVEEKDEEMEEPLVEEKDEEMKEIVTEKDEEIEEPKVEKISEEMEEPKVEEDHEMEENRVEKAEKIEEDHVDKVEETKIDQEQVEKIDKRQEIPEQIEEEEKGPEENTVEVVEEIIESTNDQTEGISESLKSEIKEIPDTKIDATEEISESTKDKIKRIPDIKTDEMEEISESTQEISDIKSDAMEETTNEQVNEFPKELIEEEKIEAEIEEKFEEKIEESRVTIEAEDEILSISQLTATTSSADMAWSPLSEISRISEAPIIQEKPQTPDVPEKRRRGRPRKSVVPSFVGGNGDSSTKIEEPKTPGTPDSQDYDRKTSESEGERSYTGRKRIPTKKYLESDIYSPSPGRRTPRTDDSQSETEEKPVKDKKRGKRGRKPLSINKTVRKSLEDYEFSDQTLDSAEESTSFSALGSPIPKSPIKTQNISRKSGTISPVNITELLATSDIEIRDNQNFDEENTEVENKSDKLSPKKSQIKKFESSQYDFLDSDEKEEPTKIIATLDDETISTENDLNQILHETEIKDSQENVLIQMETSDVPEEVNETIIEETIENIIANDDNNKITEEIEQPVKSLTVETESLEEDKTMNDVPIEEAQTEIAVQENVEIVEEHLETVEEIETLPEASSEPSLYENIEKLDEIPDQVEEKMEQVESKIENMEEQSGEIVTTIVETVETVTTETVETEKILPAITETPKTLTSVVSPVKTSVVSPLKTSEAITAKPSINNQIVNQAPQKSQEAVTSVKKREKPRIIENVTLKQPMQILKSKLLEKQPSKSQKHKLDIEMTKKLKSMPPTKMIKIDPQLAKANKSSKSGQLTISQKLQVLKAEEAKSEQLIGNTSSGMISLPTAGPQGLQNMELDIDSIPFVISEDLNPDNIEQMPVMLPAINPAPPPPSSSSTHHQSTSLTFTQTTQPVPPQIQLAHNKLSESTAEASQAKKKIGSPVILKNKSKAKPTITSVKTLTPPLTGGVKGLKFQNTQGKVLPLINPKGTQNKFIVVQTSTGQKIHYAVGTSPASQKIPIPPNKSPNQIVHQGNKVVILTSPQAVQQKMVVPFATMQKGMAQKKIIKGPQVYSQITKSPILPKTDSSSASSSPSPTTSKFVTTPKLIGTHQGQIVTSKMYTTMPPGKTIFVSSDGTKGSVFASLSGAGLTKFGNKKLISKGNIVGTIPAQSTITTKPALLSNLAGKQIITSQNLQSPKGTVLTPISGQQVKAIVGKSPIIGKVQYQQIQQKVPMLQKCQKVPISSSSSPGVNQTGLRLGTIKNTGKTVLFQNTGYSPQGTLTKISAQGKKIVRQNVPVNVKSPQILSSSPGTSPQLVTKSKSLPTTATTITQKVNTPKLRGNKNPKLLVQKIQDSPSPVKPNVSSTITKITASPKVNIKTSPVIKKSLVALPQVQQQKNISPSLGSPHAMQSSPPPLHEIKRPEIKETIATTVAAPVAVVATPQQQQQQHQPVVVATTTTTATSIPSTIEQKETIVVKPNTKVAEQPQQPAVIVTEAPKASDEQKPAHQPQIMILPTRGPDGNQTLLLVTVDEQGNYTPLDNNALMSLEGATTNPDGTQTLFIDDSSNFENLVLQFDQDTSAGTIPTHIIPQAPIVSTENSGFTNTNQDILAAALANTDFQGEIGLPETTTTTTTKTPVVSADINPTSLINQTILQSTIIPTSDPISSPLVLETSLTLNQPIMTPLEVPSSIVPITQSSNTTISTSVPGTTLEIPISIASEMNYIPDNESTAVPGNSMPDIGESIIDSHQETSTDNQTITTAATAVQEYSINPNSETIEVSTVTEVPGVSTSNVSYALSVEASGVQTTPSMPIIDDAFTENIDNVKFSSKNKNKTTKESNNVVNKEENVVKEEEKEEQQQETNKQILDMPIVGDIEENENDEKIKNVDVVDSCIPVAENSCVPSAASSVVVQKSSEEELSAESENKEINLTSQEAETSSEKKVIIDNVCEQVEAMEVDDVSYDVVEEIKQSAESSSAQEMEPMECTFSQDTVDAEPNQEIPSQSFEQFKITDNDDSPSQSAEKSSDSREPSQSEADESMEISVEPPSQSFEDSTGQEASQSFQDNSQINRADQGDSQDDPSFPTQSYDVGKVENLPESLETDGELSQEGNIPSQSNDVDIDGIGTSSFSNQANDDETASSSYVPETPEAQESDQDQESAISTSSYEISPCDDINIATSSVIPDTSGTEHASIHDNGVPEIPTSSYNLNPDSSSTHVDSQVPSSSFEDQVVVEQNVSTSYDAPISMPSIEDNSSGNFVSESGDQTNEPSSYYTRNPEEVTSEASQSYFVPEGPSPSYADQNASPSYYDTPPETEASQSFYSTQEIERTGQSSSSSSSSRNVEASQSFYQENSDEQRLRQQGEATPTYTERYPVDYPLENSSIDRHDLVESSVPATRPTER